MWIAFSRVARYSVPGRFFSARHASGRSAANASRAAT